MRFSFVFAAIGLITACATSYQPDYYYDEIRVLNNSSQVLGNLSIRVPATGGEFSCGNIAPRGLCSSRFAARRYQYNPIQIEWGHGGNLRRTQEFTVPVSPDFDTGVAIQGVVEIGDNGEMRAYFKQQDQQRNQK